MPSNAVCQSTPPGAWAAAELLGGTHAAAGSDDELESGFDEGNEDADEDEAELPSFDGPLEELDYEEMLLEHALRKKEKELSARRRLEGANGVKEGGVAEGSSDEGEDDEDGMSDGSDKVEEEERAVLQQQRVQHGSLDPFGDVLRSRQPPVAAGAVGAGGKGTSRGPLAAWEDGFLKLDELEAFLQYAEREEEEEREREEGSGTSGAFEFMDMWVCDAGGGVGSVGDLDCLAQTWAVPTGKHAPFPPPPSPAADEDEDALGDGGIGDVDSDADLNELLESAAELTGQNKHKRKRVACGCLLRPVDGSRACMAISSGMGGSLPAPFKLCLHVVLAASAVRILMHPHPQRPCLLSSHAVDDDDSEDNDDGHDDDDDEEEEEEEEGGLGGFDPATARYEDFFGPRSTSSRDAWGRPSQRGRAQQREESEGEMHDLGFDANKVDEGESDGDSGMGGESRGEAGGEEEEDEEEEEEEEGQEQEGGLGRKKETQMSTHERRQARVRARRARGCCACCVRQRV